MFASICCNIIVTINIHIVCDNPPVISVINADITVAIIAPTYGIILNSPMKNPSNGAYFTPIIVNAIETNIPTTIASKNWLAIKLVKTGC